MRWNNLVNPSARSGLSGGWPTSGASHESRFLEPGVDGTDSRPSTGSTVSAATSRSIAIASPPGLCASTVGASGNARGWHPQARSRQRQGRNRWPRAEVVPVRPRGPEPQHLPTDVPSKRRWRSPVHRAWERGSRRGWTSHCLEDRSTDAPVALFQATNRLYSHRTRPPIRGTGANVGPTKSK